MPRPNYSGIPNNRDVLIQRAMQIKDDKLRLKALAAIAKGV